MTATISKRRGKNVLFKSQLSPATHRRDKETVVITWNEAGITKNATFRGDGCQQRANRRVRMLERAGHQVGAVSFGGAE